jgi:phosphoribosyl 1,2-cyclic phosphodiesterase
MVIQLTVLGSGSAGNCTLIESARTRLLVDAGLSARQITQRLAHVHRSLDAIDAILLTHEHSDHRQGLTVLSKRRPLPVYANRLTAEAVHDEAGDARLSWRLFTNGQAFEIGDFTIEPFSVPHDAQDPVGFLIHQNGFAIGVVTDLGHVTQLVMERVRAVDVLILESNHDLRLLQDNPDRPWSLKQRIMSRHGHLSNDAAAQLAGTVVSDRLRHICLAHLSRDCNRPELARRAVETSLRRAGANHVTVAVADQDTPTTPLFL